MLSLLHPRKPQSANANNSLINGAGISRTTTANLRRVPSSPRKAASREPKSSQPSPKYMRESADLHSIDRQKKLRDLTRSINMTKDKLFPQKSIPNQLNSFSPHMQSKISDSLFHNNSRSDENVFEKAMRENLQSYTGQFNLLNPNFQPSSAVSSTYFKEKQNNSIHNKNFQAMLKESIADKVLSKKESQRTIPQDVNTFHTKLGLTKNISSKQPSFRPVDLSLNHSKKDSSLVASPQQSKLMKLHELLYPESTQTSPSKQSNYNRPLSQSRTMTRVPSQPFSELLPETGSSENKYSMKSILLPDSREQGQQNLQHAASFGQILHFHSQSSNFVKPPTNTRDKILDKLMETKEKLNSTPAYSVIGQQGVAKQHPYLQPPSPLIANSKVMPSQISRPTHEAQDLPSEFRPSFHSKLADLLASKNSSSQIFKKAQPEDPSSPSAQQEPHQSLLFSTKQSSAVAQSQSQALIPKSSSARDRKSVV